MCKEGPYDSVYYTQTHGMIITNHYISKKRMGFCKTHGGTVVIMPRELFHIKVRSLYANESESFYLTPEEYFQYTLEGQFDNSILEYEDEKEEK